MIQTFCGPSLSLTHYSHAGSQPSLFEEGAYQRENSPHEHGGDHQGFPSQMVHGEHAENIGRDLCNMYYVWVQKAFTLISLQSTLHYLTYETNENVADENVITETATGKAHAVVAEVDQGPVDEEHDADCPHIRLLEQ